MDPVTLRAIERILVVLFAGMAIYLGYRLFLAVPTQRDSDGRLTLPGGTQVVLNRAAPGLFFALFSSVALALSLHSAIQATSPSAAAPQASQTSQTPRVLASYSGLASQADVDPAVALARLRRFFYTLNTLTESSAREGSQGVAERGDVRQVKLLLLRSAWQEAWGDYAAFAGWADRTDARGAPPDPRLAEPAALFHQGAAHQGQAHQGQVGQGGARP